MKHFVTIEDWDTLWPYHQRKKRDHRPGVDYFQAVSGYVSSGPTTPLKTNFTQLTEAQVDILKKENQYWRDVEQAQKGNTLVMVRRGKYEVAVAP